MRKVKEGQIYIIKNPAWNDWCKIGLTTTTVESRVRTYQTNSPFRDYYSVFSIHTWHISQLEFNIHERLRKEGYINNSEWFKIEETEAINIIIEERELLN